MRNVAGLLDAECPRHGVEQAMSAGPWQARRLTCEASTAGVASVGSAVVMSPAAKPLAWASSRMVGRSWLAGSTEMALSA
jgi:hypothetical protein